MSRRATFNWRWRRAIPRAGGASAAASVFAAAVTGLLFTAAPPADAPPFLREAGREEAPPAAAPAAAAAQGDWLVRVQARLDRVESFRARFTQEFEPRAFSRRQSEGGVVEFRRPGRMRWEYEWPEPKLALSDGARAWVYYPEERRAEVQRLAELGEEAPAVQLLLGRWRLPERFRLEGLARRQGEVTLHLRPEPPMAGIAALRVSVADDRLDLRGVEVEEPGGNVLRYRFEEWLEGAAIPEERFRFTPPRGVKVEGQSGAPDP
jgi:outer membrane lipoprotein carrier protein